MAIKAVTFDAGGTLLFPKPSVAETFVAAAAEFGYEIPPDEAESHISACWTLYFNEYHRDGDFWCTHEGCKRIWIMQYDLLCDLCGVVDHKADVSESVYRAFLRGHHWGMFEDVVPALEELHARGLKLAVISNWDADLLNILDDLGLSRFFDVRVASGQAGLRKPHRAIFDYTLGKLGLEASEVLHVGDMDDADGFGPLEAGLFPLIIERHGKAHGEGLSVIDDLRKIAGHIDALDVAE